MTGQIVDLTDECRKLKQAVQDKEIVLRHIKDVINYRDKEQEIGNCLAATASAYTKISESIHAVYLLILLQVK